MSRRAQEAQRQGCSRTLSCNHRRRRRRRRQRRIAAEEESKWSSRRRRAPLWRQGRLHPTIEEAVAVVVAVARSLRRRKSFRPTTGGVGGAVAIRDRVRLESNNKETGKVTIHTAECRFGIPQYEKSRTQSTRTKRVGRAGTREGRWRRGGKTNSEQQTAATNTKTKTKTKTKTGNRKAM